MLTPKGQIQREGKVSFGDASLSIWEESIPAPRRDFKELDAWELAFKRQVFARIVQTLNRLGWTCVVPESYIKQYGFSFARDRRECSKGDLKGFLDVSGRTIGFEMWQGVNTPTRPDNGGRYESDKEGCMPYLLRLEMERTRRRIRDYLCNVFSGYEFDPVNRSHEYKPLRVTAMDRIKERSGRWPETWPQEPEGYYSRSKDGKKLSNGMRVFYYDYHGRMGAGIAYFDGGMWDVVTGKWDRARHSNTDLYVECPGNPRIKHNPRQRRKRLDTLLADAIKAMDFKRAEQIKKILWPVPEPLYLIQKGDLFFGSNFCGYTKDSVRAGKYTAEELKRYASDIQRGDLKAVPLAAV
ncbi:hypothetical protein LZ683_08685 [Comamonas testosteroni]|uniref:hypothetical protein n=1 Tax=Comamonas testosteroni TaxID=285 RepID=UPI0023AA8DA0|nr:hypothetical protein [Comamonas testosteroni]WEE79417.1 hypothetical protein LZ683_08685 [Comamonas testosteroni]